MVVADRNPCALWRRTGDQFLECSFGGGMPTALIDQCVVGRGSCATMAQAFLKCHADGLLVLWQLGHNTLRPCDESEIVGRIIEIIA